jgi:hypothetical protein
MWAKGLGIWGKMPSLERIGNKNNLKAGLTNRVKAVKLAVLNEWSGK